MSINDLLTLLLIQSLSIFGKFMCLQCSNPQWNILNYTYAVEIFQGEKFYYYILTYIRSIRID